jgi:hypothetical protein
VDVKQQSLTPYKAASKTNCFVSLLMLFYSSLYFLVDLMAMNVATQSFEQHQLRGQNDNLMDIIQIINCLSTMYEIVAQSHQDLVNVPLCVDLVLNWILNIYDV